MQKLPRITIRPVAWTVKDIKEEVTMYQASAHGTEQTRIFGDPKATPRGALSSLRDACSRFATLAAAATQLLSDDDYNQQLTDKVKQL